MREYSRELRKMGIMLNRAGQYAAAKRYQETKNPTYRNELVLSATPYAIRVASGYAKKYGCNHLFADLVQEANIGLIKAAEKYDYRVGCTFTTYATAWIRQMVGLYILNHMKI